VKTDAAAPETRKIEVAIDVKRIEVRRDIHKRADGIIIKATKFKKKHPKSLSVASGSVFSLEGFLDDLTV
jgi:hypothetical protein